MPMCCGPQLGGVMTVWGAGADLNGRFRGATQLKGIKGFYAEDQALWPIRLETWGHFVFLLFDNSP